MPANLDKVRCPICSGERLAWRASSVACESCGASYPLSGGIPILVRNPESHQADIERAQSVNPLWYVDEQPPEEASPWRHHIRKRRIYVESVLKRELNLRGSGKAQALLDLGCGDGNNLKWLAPYANKIYGSDYNALRLARARHLQPTAQLFLADILDYPAVNGAFDVIFFNHVIEHIPDDSRALAEVHRILAPGGLLILGTPNEGAWWWQVAYKRDPRSLATTDHVHFYTAESIVEKMQQAGLKVTEVHHMGWGPPDWELDGRWRRHKFVDDGFEWIGKLLLRRQASSLYIVATA